MHSITQIDPHIHRLTIPYKDIYTTVCTLRTPQGVILFDGASVPEETETYILPFLQQVGVRLEEVKYVFISHYHNDHSGALPTLLPLLPNATLLSRSGSLRQKYADYPCRSIEDGEVLLGAYRVVTIPGHSVDASGLLDLRSNTLISSDCLQAYGICGSGEWAAFIPYPVEYVAAIEKLRNLDIQQIIAAHVYEPQGYRVQGEQAVAKYLDDCLVPLQRIQKLILENPQLDDEALRGLFNYDPTQPRIQARVIGAMRLAMTEGKIEML